MKSKYISAVVRQARILAGSGLFTLGLVLIFASCDVPADRGMFNLTGAEENQLVTVKIDPNLTISRVNDRQVDWRKPDNNYSQVVRMAPGIYMFEVNYDDGNTRTLQPVYAVAKLTNGNKYTISQSINGVSITIQISTKKNGVEESAIFNMNSLSEDDGPLAVYVINVLNPTLVNPDAKILLSNDNEDILFEHDLVYRKTDKNTDQKTEGRYAIEMDFSMGGRIYFLETDLSTLSMEDFLNSDFRQQAQVIAVPVICDGKTVTYRYTKPESLDGKEEVYTITNLTPVPETAVEAVIEIDDISE
jgi:hypothetical protein